MPCATAMCDGLERTGIAHEECTKLRQQDVGGTWEGRDVGGASKQCTLCHVAGSTRRTVAFFPPNRKPGEVNLSVTVTNVSFEFTKLVRDSHAYKSGHVALHAIICLG